MIGSSTYPAGALDPANACQSCQPGVDPGAWSPLPDLTPCDDGLACTGGDACHSGVCGGTPLACPGGSLCADACSTATLGADCGAVGFRAGTLTCHACQVDASGCTRPGVKRTALFSPGQGCLLLVDGTLSCFGSYAVTAPSGETFSDLAGIPSQFLICGLHAADGTLACWSPTGPASAPSGSFTHLQTHGEALLAFASDHFVALQLGSQVQVGMAARDAVLDPVSQTWVTIDADGGLFALGFPPGAYRQLAVIDSTRQVCALDAQDQLWCSGNLDGGPPYVQATGVEAVAGPTLGSLVTLDADGRLRDDLESRTTAPELRFTNLDALSADLVCGSTPKGEARCFGPGSMGQTRNWQGHFAHLHAGRSRVCAQDGNGVLHCHGLGSPSIPAQVARVSGPAWLDADGGLVNRPLDVSSTGELIEPVRDGTYAAVDGHCALSPAGEILCFGLETPPSPGPFHSLSAVSGQGCALDALGEAHCWGTGSMPISAGPWDAVEVGGGVLLLRQDGTTVVGYADSPWLTNLQGAPWVTLDGAWTLSAAGDLQQAGQSTALAHVGAGAELWGDRYGQQACAFDPSTGLVGCIDGSGNPLPFLSRPFVRRLPGSGCFWDQDGILMCPPVGSLPKSYTRAVTLDWGACEVVGGAWSCEQLDFTPPVTLPAGTYLDGSLVASGGAACALNTSHHPRCVTSDPAVQINLLPANLAFDKLAIDGSAECGLDASGAMTCVNATALSGSGYDELAIFDQDVCAKRASDGALLCNGASSFFTPDPAGTFVHIDGRQSILCGQLVDRSLQCWQRWPWRPLATPSGPFAEFSVGGSYVCGLRDSGDLECFGGEADLDLR